MAVFRIALFASPLLSQSSSGYAWGLNLRDDSVPGVPCNSICAPVATEAISGSANGSDCTNSFAEQYAQSLDCGVQLDSVMVPNQAQLVQTSLDDFLAACKQLGHRLKNVTVAGSFKGFASTTGGSAGAGQTVSQSPSRSAAQSASTSNPASTSTSRGSPSPTTPSASPPVSSGGATNSNGGNGPAQWTRMHAATVGAMAPVLLDCGSRF
ncbi:hypothetical protein DFH09DRAFT_1187999 [Mycena vulgaris]|nr:hypothetical protein DFH09DRAFT_1187999 [Mycena vulgaris]